MVNEKLKKFRVSDLWKAQRASRYRDPGALLTCSCHSNKTKGQEDTDTLAFSLSDHLMELIGVMPKASMDLEVDVEAGVGHLFVDKGPISRGRTLSLSTSGRRASLRYVVPKEVFSDFSGTCTAVEADKENQRIAFKFPQGAFAP